MYQWANHHCGEMAAVEADDATVYRIEYAQENRKGEVQRLPLHHRPGLARRVQHDAIDGGRNGQDQSLIRQIRSVL